MNNSLWKADQINILNSTISSKLRHAGFRNKIGNSKTFVEDEFLRNVHKKSYHKIKTILFLSTISKNKGIYEAINTFKLINKRNPDIKYIVAGDGPELKNIKMSLGKDIKQMITFTGYVSGSDKENIFLKSDLYIFPSYYEGMPISLLEAMGSGLPVICSDAGAIPDFFENGKMGYMIKELDPNVYANKI